MASPTSMLRVPDLEVAAALRAPEGGFAGNLRCATLADLVQLQCLARARVTVIVNSGSRSGALHFNDGDVVHASVGEQTGQDAALEILSWVGGAFEMLDLTELGPRSVALPWQHLLMTAAQRYDEGRHNNDDSEITHAPADEEPKSQRTERRTTSSGVIPRGALVEALFADLLTSENGADSSAAEPTAVQAIGLPAPSSEALAPAPDSKPRERWADMDEFVTCAVRLDSAGRVVDGRGDTDALGSLCRYVRRVVELMGDELGLPHFQLFEGRSLARNVVVFPEASGNSVALQLCANADMARLHQLLGCP